MASQAPIHNYKSLSSRTLDDTITNTKSPTYIFLLQLAASFG